jgi:hypothetical protein
MQGRIVPPLPCCDDCLPAHRGDWEVRPNPHLLYGAEGPSCAFCGSSRPSRILTLACPLEPRNVPN